MKKKRYPRGLPAQNRNKRSFTIIFTLFIIVVLMILAERQIRPVIESVASYQAKVFALKSINEAMTSELEDSGITYDDIVKITHNTAGGVTSVQSNMMEINKLKSRMTQIVVLQLENQQSQPVRVPLGTLVGNQLTAGRGPTIEIRIIPTGYVQTEIYNQFYSAGINQTLHQIMLKVSVKMLAIVPGYTVQTETVTNFCVAETVIVGEIPEGFTQINGEDSSTISKINDYAATIKEPVK